MVQSYRLALPEQPSERRSHSVAQARRRRDNGSCCLSLRSWLLLIAVAYLHVLHGEAPALPNHVKQHPRPAHHGVAYQVAKTIALAVAVYVSCKCSPRGKYHV